MSSVALSLYKPVNNTMLQRRQVRLWIRKILKEHNYWSEKNEARIHGDFMQFLAHGYEYDHLQERLEMFLIMLKVGVISGV